VGYYLTIGGVRRQHFCYSPGDNPTNDELWLNAQPQPVGPICRYCHAKLPAPTPDMECEECKNVANARTFKKEDRDE
jgi:hypothetical protein